MSSVILFMYNNVPNLQNRFFSDETTEFLQIFEQYGLHVYLEKASAPDLGFIST